MTAIRFPGETATYRAARDELLEAERDLRARAERVASMRRSLPLGGAVPEDYVFEEGWADARAAARSVRMSELFDRPEGTLVLYSFMFGPNMAQACPMCTSFLDGLNGNAEHIAQRVSLAIVAKSPIARILEFARSRGWTHLRLLSSASSNFNRAYHAENDGGRQTSIIHTFVRRAGVVYHAYSSELPSLPSEPGQDPRHIDLMWPLWNVLDLTPEGRGSDWRPKLAYT